VIHAVPDSTASHARRHLEELLGKAGCAAPVQIAIGPVKETLLEAACQAGADVLIVGRRPRAGALGRLRDLTYSLIRHSPFPVLNV
jgi:nucleotide-binding universal stress UspA family protein